MNKYELVTTDTITVEGHTLYRVRRLQDGQLGGYIEAEANLSQSGSCFLANGARAFEAASVSDDAQLNGVLRGRASLKGKAILNGEAYDDALITDEAIVNGKVYEHGTAKGRSRVFGEVFGSAVVQDDAKVLGRAFGRAVISGHEVVLGDRDR